jgi:hypothetical protein
MDANLNDMVICCFCGEPLLLKRAVVLSVQPNIEREEWQNLFCHKNHLIEKIDKSIVLHPDLFEEQDDIK